MRKITNNVQQIPSVKIKKSFLLSNVEKSVQRRFVSSSAPAFPTQLHAGFDQVYWLHNTSCHHARETAQHELNPFGLSFCASRHCRNFLLSLGTVVSDSMRLPRPLQPLPSASFAEMRKTLAVRERRREPARKVPLGLWFPQQSSQYAHKNKRKQNIQHHLSPLLHINPTEPLQVNLYVHPLYR